MEAAAPKRAARTVERNPVFRVLARAGYAANGVVHVLVGVIAIVIANGGDAEGDQASAFMVIADAPLGFIALWALAICLWALAAYHLAEGVLAYPRSQGDAPTTLSKWGVRISEWGQTLVFAALGLLAASVALGARVNGERTAEETSRGLLSIPGGAWMLGLIGVGIGVGGIAFGVMGVRRSFRTKMRIPDGALGVTVTTLGVIGFVAKGVSLVIIGVLLVIAAVRVDPETAGGLDGALRALLDLAGGPTLVVVVGAGLIAYGVFCGFRARFAKL